MKKKKKKITFSALPFFLIILLLLLGNIKQSIMIKSYKKIISNQYLEMNNFFNNNNTKLDFIENETIKTINENKELKRELEKVQMMLLFCNQNK